jgi:hypothetical protein
MTKYTIAFNIECNDQREAASIKQAYQAIANHLPAEDLIWVAKEINKNPLIIQKVKKLASNPLVQSFF